MTEHLHITPIGNVGMYILDTASWRVLRPVLDQEKCIRCGICLSYCPVNSIHKDEEGKYEIHYDYCKGCGICANECIKDAIEMVPEGGVR